MVQREPSARCRLLSWRDRNASLCADCPPKVVLWIGDDSPRSAQLSQEANGSAHHCAQQQKSPYSGAAIRTKCEIEHMHTRIHAHCHPVFASSLSYTSHCPRKHAAATQVSTKKSRRLSIGSAAGSAHAALGGIALSTPCEGRRDTSPNTRLDHMMHWIAGLLRPGCSLSKLARRFEVFVREHA